MNGVNPPAYFSSNKMGRIIYLAMEEVLGSSGIAETLLFANLAHRVGQYPPDNLDRQVSFHEISGTQAALERLYGQRGGPGLALKSGRVCFKYGLREFGSDINHGSASFRLMPLQAKVSRGIARVAQTINKISDQQVSVSDDEHSIYWNVENCPDCWSRKSDRPICHMTAGMLDELLTWISGGRRFRVEEIRCTAQGDPACVMRLDKLPYE
jgi:predicted hydrocarbon binding protein